MDKNDIDKIYQISDELVDETEMEFKRCLYSEIDWNSRVICIKGPRGVGKTTMMLQHIKEALEPGKALYVSLDNVWMDPKEVYSLAEYHLGHGGTHLYLDEVHKLENWQDLVKNIYDVLKRLKVVYSGSSLLKMEAHGGDLSRRQSQYRLEGLSFREYLELEGVANLRRMTLEEILTEHVSEARQIRKKLPVLKYFDQYIKTGYYPFYREEPAQYHARIIEVVNQVLDVDYPAIEEVEVATVRKARRMLAVLAASAPLTPNMSKLYAELGTDRKQGIKMLYALERAGLLSLLAEAGKESLKNMPTPDKIYCDNTNLMSALVPNPDIGTLRETFFLNALRQSHSVSYPKKGDFKVDGKYVFEIGGPGKGFDQIADIENSFVVNDGVEVGFGNKIPLWLFGMMY